MQIKNLVLGIAIIILTIFVSVYGISLIFPSVEYNSYCGDLRTAQFIETAEQCDAVGGKWTPQDIKCITEPCPQGYCDRYFTCENEYDKARESRAMKVFFIAIPLGIILIFLGGYLFGLEAVGAGLMGGGVGTIIYGAGSYWQFGGDLLRFVLSLIGLIAVIYLSYWLNKRMGKRKK